MFIRVGNAAREAGSHRGWILGQFMPSDDERYSNDVEVKWGLHKAGERREWGVSDFTTLTILIRGRIRQYFVSGEYVLSSEGDYALYGPGMTHCWEVEEEDTLIITVRWLSKSS